MPIMMSRLYAALKLAGVSDDKAIEAAEEIAAYENRLANIESRLSVLTWMVGFNIAMTVAILASLIGRAIGRLT